jgi:hypothetical protein
MRNLFLTIVLVMLALPAVALERSQMQEIHADAAMRYANESATMTITFMPNDVIDVSEGYLREVYDQLSDMGADPLIKVIEVRRSDMRHVVTCANGFCFDPAATMLVPEAVLKQPSFRVVKTGKLPE